MNGRNTATVAALCVAAALLAAIGPKQADAQSLVAATAARHCSSLAASRHRSLALRSLSSVKMNKIEHYCAEARPHINKLRFWFSRKHRWTLYLNHARQKCWQLRLRGPLGLCMRARSQVRTSSRRLSRLTAKITALVPGPVTGTIQNDLAAAAGRRSCIAGVETPGSSHPYTQLNPSGTYKGRYQYDDGSWQVALSKAQSFYGVAISPALRADEASPWAQDVVTSFAVLHSSLLGWDPWAECR